jgi:septal ring factor EnvC (AmiA/AmiB activator)
MKVLRMFGQFVVLGSFLAMASLTGCTKKPNKEELTKVDEAKSAAESAEKKLSELRQERQQLETTLQQKQADVRQGESERDDVKKKTGK